jgi:hypothetical protein
VYTYSEESNNNGTKKMKRIGGRKRKKIAKGIKIKDRRVF